VQPANASMAAALSENPADPRTADYVHGRFG
jgi:hypothetical protein